MRGKDIHINWEKDVVWEVQRGMTKVGVLPFLCYQMISSSKLLSINNAFTF
jgi:hypothetical protein